MTYPTRLICLTEEATEVLYALREKHCIVGVSGFTVHPSVKGRRSRVCGRSPPPRSITFSA